MIITLHQVQEFVLKTVMLILGHFSLITSLELPFCDKQNYDKKEVPICHNSLYMHTVENNRLADSLLSFIKDFKVFFV